MSRNHIQQLAPIRGEYTATRFALEYVERTWHRLEIRTEARRVHEAQIRRAIENLEATYIIRLFSEFEAILRDYWAAGHNGTEFAGRTEKLIDRVASARRIEAQVRDNVHAVREYRNAVVHHRTTESFTLRFHQAISALNHFLTPLRDSP